MSPLVHSASEQRWTLIPKVTEIVLIRGSELQIDLIRLWR